MGFKSHKSIPSLKLGCLTSHLLASLFGVQTLWYCTGFVYHSLMCMPAVHNLEAETAVSYQ